MFWKFEEIQEELYLINSNEYDEVTSWYESISSEAETETSETESYLDTENEYGRNRYNTATGIRKQWKLYGSN